MSLSIIIPAYREAENLDVLLPQIKNEVHHLTKDSEILVIDTMDPMDDTKSVCIKHQVGWIKRVDGNNFGDAIRTGIKNSKGNFLIVMDGDGSHDPEFIKSLWGKRHEGEIIIASRFMQGGSSDNPFILTLLSKILNFVFELAAGTVVHDTSGGFRLYNGPHLRSLDLECNHFDIQQEMLVKMTHNDPKKVLEIPYHFKERMHGNSKRKFIRFAINYFRTIYRLRKYQSRATSGAWTKR